MPQCPQYIYCLPTSLLVPHWFVAYKLYNAVIPKDEIFHVDVYSNIIMFLSNDMGFNTIDFNM